MSKKFQPLDYSRGWDDYWRDHPQGYSPQEQMVNWSGQLNAMIDFINEYFDVDLTEYAIDVLEGWYFDGRLEYIINEALFNSKADKTTVNSLIDRLTDQEYGLDVINATKANKNEVFLKDSGINVSDFDEPTRQTFLEAQGIDVNYILGAENVKPVNTTFFQRGTNIFNKNAVTLNQYVAYLTGDLVAGSGWYTSDFINIKPNTNYIIKKVRAYAFYDASHTFISGENLAAYDNVVITSPGNAVYIRFSYSSTIEMDINQMNEGSSLLDFEPFKEYIPKEKLELEIENENIVDKSISFYKTDFVIIGKNLFNKNTAILGKYINHITGELMDNSNYVASDWILVEPEKYYTISHGIMLAFYDYNKDYISGLPSGDTNTPATFTTPAKCYWVRVSLFKSRLTTYQIEKGSVFTGYEPYQLTIPGLAASNDVEIVSNYINLPSTIHTLTTFETDIFFENVMNKSQDKDIDVVCNQGKQLEKKYNHIFDAAGIVPITLNTYKDGKLITSKGSMFDIKAPTDITGNFKAIAIGDSTTSQATTGWVKKVTELISAEGTSTIEWVGTKGTAPNLHEGLTGWSALRYTTESTNNAFWNPTTSEFDFSYYMNQNTFSGLTHAFIHLGINDIFSITSDSEMVAEISNTLTRFDIMVNSIHNYDADIKKCIMLTVPPTNSQDRFGTYYDANQTQWRYKRTYDYFVSELIKKYDNRTAEGIHLVATNVCYDVETDINDGVHPNAGGYGKMGEQVYKFLKVIG